MNSIHGRILFSREQYYLFVRVHFEHEMHYYCTPEDDFCLQIPIILHEQISCDVMKTDFLNSCTVPPADLSTD